MSQIDSIIREYPELATIVGKVSDQVLIDQFNECRPEFENSRKIASEHIPVSLLATVFDAAAEQGQITLETFLGRWGNVTIEEVCKIALILRWLKPSRVFEFGTYNGMTTRQIALNVPNDCEVFTLDLDPTDRSVTELSIGAIDQYIAEKTGAFDVKVGEYFIGTTQETKITQLLGDSMTYDYSPYYGTADLVFVDAGHTYDYVKSDTENALRLIKPGGVILWHDYMRVLHPGVTRCLSEYALKGLSIHQLRGTNLAVHRSDE